MVYERAEVGFDENATPERDEGQVNFIETTISGRRDIRETPIVTGRSNMIPNIKTSQLTTTLFELLRWVSG